MIYYNFIIDMYDMRWGWEGKDNHGVCVINCIMPAVCILRQASNEFKLKLTSIWWFHHHSRWFSRLISPTSVVLTGKSQQRSEQRHLSKSTCDINLQCVCVCVLSHTTWNTHTAYSTESTCHIFAYSLTLFFEVWLRLRSRTSGCILL